MADEPTQQPKRLPIAQLVPRDDRASAGIYRKGAHTRILGDIYHRLMRQRWSVVIAVIVATYLVANVFFACVYLAIGGVEHARPGSFGDAFFFSIHTMSTVGYGTMAPITLAANIVVTVEIILGLLQVAMATGLLFAKFSRPTARVLFSKVAIVQPFEGVPSLMFRMANERTNQIVEAQLRLVLARNELTKEGERIRRMSSLKLVRDSTTIFGLTWLAIHPIDESSPLHGATPETLADIEAEIVCSLTGYDEAFGQTIHARFSYTAEEIRFGHRFIDVLSRLPDGRRQIDLDVFHETTPTV